MLVLLAGLALVFGITPFDTKGAIRASDACKTLGKPSRSVAALERILPDESSYSFDDDVTDLRLDETDDSYESSCFVSGGGKQILVATAEMAEYDCRHLSGVVELEQQGNAPARLSQ